jgi:hypothetical protein
MNNQRSLLLPVSLISVYQIPRRHSLLIRKKREKQINKILHPFELKKILELQLLTLFQ